MEPIEQQILFIDEVAKKFRAHSSSIRRWLAETRAGKGNLIPLPVSQQGAKLRWLASDVERFLAAQSSVLPVKISTSKQRRQDKSDAARRSAEAAKGIDRHRQRSK